MKFPYGISDFKRIVTEDYFYRDRTDRIPLIEDAGPHLLFIRPRRFGKSLLLSMLANYYDVAKKDEFDALFGHLKTGNSPTPLRNRFFILEWDFSCVDPMGDAEKIRRALHDHINSSIDSFHNPDYKWANELTVRTAFLTLLYNDNKKIATLKEE